MMTGREACRISCSQIGGRDVGKEGESQFRNPAKARFDGTGTEGMRVEVKEGVN